MKKQKKSKEKPKQESIIIPKRAIYRIVPAIAISAILISKHDIGPLFLFLIGIFTGIFIAKGFFEK